MQLHQFACIVFIDAALSPLLLLLRRPLLLGPLRHLVFAARNASSAKYLLEASAVSTAIVSGGLGVWRYRLKIIEVKEHSGMLCRPDDKVLKIPKCILPQNVAFVAWDVPSHSRFS